MPEQQGGQILIASKYVDLAGPAILQSYEKIKGGTVNMAKEFDSLKRSIRASMASTRDAIVKAMQESSVASKKHTDEMARHARTFGFEITGLLKRLGSLRNTILLYLFAFRPFINIVKESTSALMEQEDAIKRINYAMGIQGTQSEFMSNRLIKLSKAFQETTRYGDEAILQVMERLITTGRIMPSQLEKVTQAVLDLSAATGRDLTTSADLLARASQGITTGLRRQGIAIDELTPKSKVLNEVMKYINEHMGGRAQKDIDSYSGRFKQLGNAINDAGESLGLFILEVFKLDKGAVTLKNFFNALANKEPLTELERVKNELYLLNKAIQETTGRQPVKLFGIKIGEANLGGPSEVDIKEKGRLLSRLGKAQTEERIKQDFADIKAAEEAKKQEKLLIEEDFSRQYMSLQFRRLEVAKQTYEEDKANFIAAGIEKNKLDIWEMEQKSNLLKLEREEFKKHSQSYVIFMEGAARGMKTALSDGFIKIIKRDFEGLKDIVVDLGNALLEAAVQAAAEGILRSTGFAAFLGGAHTGGPIYAKDVFYGMPRRKYHSGGEVPATLLKGEYVMNRNAVKNVGVDNLNRLNRGESLGSGTTINNFYIQTIDERSFRERLQQNPDIYVNATERGIKDNASIRSTTQRFG